MDAANFIYAEAYNQSRFLNNSELDCLRKHVADGLANIEAAQEISNNCESLIQESYEAICNIVPQYASKIESWHKCRREIDHFLRAITYCLVSENASPLNQYFLNEIDDPYNALSLQADCLILALNKISESDFLSKQSLKIIAPYVNHIISIIITASQNQSFSETTSDKYSRKWPEELASFYGSIQDESFGRQPQPKASVREEL